MRGLGYGRTLVLIDGLPANDAFYGTVQWNLVPMSSIESAEFVRGGVSSLYGNYGMGGVININTKTPKNSSQDVSASYGSFGTGNVAASKDLIVSDGMQMRFSADYFSSEGFQNYATISPGSSSNIKNGMGTDAVKNSNIRLQNYFKPNQDTTGFLRLGYSTMADLSTNYAIAPNLVQTADFAAGSTTKLDVDKKAQVNVYYQNTNFYKQSGSTSTTAPNKNQPYVNANYTDPYSTVGASAQYTHDLKGAGIDQYILGADARNISASNLTNNLNSNGSGSVTSVNYAQGQQNFYGLLGQLKSTASAFPLETTLGARLDFWNSQTPTLYNAGVNGANPIYQNIPNKSKTQLSPSLGFVYKATQNWDLRSAAYQAFHAPSMNNTLRSYGSTSGGYFFANPNLTPETMTGYEVGTDYRWKEGFAQFTAFNNYIQNAITSYNLSTASDAALASSLCASAGNPQGCSLGKVNYYTNQQNLLSRGIEMQYHQDINPHWGVDAGYAYTSTILTWSATTDPINTQVGGVPKNMANAGITYYPVPQASLTTTVRYVGNSWMATGSLPVPAYAVVGLKANYQVTPQASVFASVVNLFNRQYVTFNIASQATAYQAGMPQAITVGARLVF
ncbi:TonB-dependent receptor [Polynucleobacter necessarius]|uniref:TonB-dependent receptor n=1 Tax=Polynucleobacter necessarius TaxID=576610 RepID=UPI000E093846|nr:TonB-dependent receptor [Polynucleobacter necessarius]